MRLTGQGLKGLTGPLISSLIFIVVTVMATGLLAASITDTNSGDRVAYYAKFTDVAGLHPGHGVRIAGVRVGTVEKISVTDRRLALVKFTVDRDRDLPASTTASVKYLNLVGGRYVALAQGTGAPGQTLRRGGTIPVERTTGPLNLTQLFQGFQPLMQALSPGDVNSLSESIVKVLQGEGGTVESLLRTVGELTTTIAGRDRVIGQVISNLNTIVGTINDRDRQLVELLTTLRKLTSGLAADRKPIGEAVVALGDLSTATADLLHVGRAPLKSSIGELGRLSRNLDRDEPLVDRFLRRLPNKLENLGRLYSYASWTNFYQCEVKLIGVHYAGSNVDGRPPPTGLPITDDGRKRCLG
ncbi:MCE family protein [Actinomadura fulvescens]|uniref:MlaD family protein n=1 Tax=Actinomadura fulvescens TaxID=46160 RepID=A0ABP6C1X0_9ACTN